MRQYFKNGTRCETLLLMTNRKLHVRFRLAPRSMTSDDCELLSSNFLGISRGFADLRSNNFKRMKTLVVSDRILAHQCTFLLNYV